MKILHVIPHFLPSPNFGGTPEVCHNIAQEQAAQGHSVDVLTTDVYSKSRRINNLDLTYESNQVYTVLRKRNISNWLAYYFKISSSPEAYKFLKTQATYYDIIHLHEYRTILNVMAAINKPPNTKIVLHPQGTFENFNSRQLFKQLFDFFFARLILSKCAHIIALSHKERDLLIDSGVESKYISIMNNAVDQHYETEYNLELKLPSKFILYLGRINRIKNIDALIKAFNRSLAPQSGIHLVIAGGDDGYLSELLNIIKANSNISYLGPLNNNQKAAVISKSLFVSYVTLNEPWGLVPLEAACLGVPSLVSSDAGVSEVITKYGVGKLTDPHSVNDISKGINSMITDPPKLSKKKLQKLKYDFSWKEYTHRLMEIYKS